MCWFYQSFSQSLEWPKDDGKKKSAIIKLYDFTKGETDVVDQKMGNYSVKPNSSKWTVSGDNVRVMISDDSQ